jgi:hypothetical protein
MSSRRRKGSKPVPSILKTPIERSRYASKDTVARQRQTRLCAVYEFYGVQHGMHGAEAELIAAMAAERFPAGFRIVPVGAPRTKQRIWDCFRRTHLLEFMENRLASGMTQEQAAELYRKRHFANRGSAKGLVAEYHRAERFSRLGKLTELEELEVDALLRKERKKFWASERATRVDHSAADSTQFD